MDTERQQPQMEDVKVSHEDPPPFDGPSAESEEMLPLYTESHIRREADGSITPPDVKATPDQVRDFIVELLTTCRGLHVDHARRVAARWTLGNGQEMRAYPPWMYRDIFGFEDGWVVYKEVHVVLHNAGRKRRQQIAIGCLTFAMLWVATCGLIFGLSRSDSLTAVVSGSVGLLGIMVLLGSAIGCCAVRQSAEAAAEFKLKASYSKASEPRPL